MLGTVLGVKYTSLNKTVFPLVELNFWWRKWTVTTHNNTEICSVMSDSL